MTPFHRLFPMLLRAAFPQDCLLCAGPAGEAPVCRGCERDLLPVPAHCPQCALPCAGGLCGACLRRAPAYDATMAVWQYAFPCDRLLHAYKYRARLQLAPYFAACLADRMTARGPLRADVLLPMPLHRRRLAQRGFNQAAEIARALSRLTGAPVLYRAARRHRDTRTQADLPLAERAANVRGAFHCGDAVRGACVAVVDDIMTTGATLEALARTLKQAGAARVENLVMARTLPG